MLGDERISQAYAENAEFWITVVRDRLDPFQLELTDPAILASVGDPAGLVILDAGCGEGHLVRELTAARARHVHGVDTCAEFIAAARSHPEHRADSTTFHHGDVAALPLADASVDLVVANRLPHGIRARLLEPCPTARQRRENPWWDENFVRPLFLLLECEPRG